MTDKIVLNKALGTYDIVQINNNFDKIAKELNEKVLYRENPAGTANQVKSNLDMNGFKILNIPAPASDNEPARLKDVANAVAGLADRTANLVSFEPTSKIAATNVQGAVEAVMDRASLVVDASYYITNPGVSNSADILGIQTAINAVVAQGGGRVRVRKPISVTIDFATSLTVPTNVVIDDERYSDVGHTVNYSTGGDVEHRLHGTAVPGGEGPSYTCVNNNSTGDRTSSLVARYGPGAGSSVNVYMHMGVWDGTNWYREFDMITPGADGFRSNLRVGYGTVQVNGVLPGATQYSQNRIVSIYKPAAMGGGLLLDVGPTVTNIHTELRVLATNAPIRHGFTDGTLSWSWLDQYPVAGQLCLYDHNSNSNKIVFTSAGVTSHTGTFRPSGDNVDNLGGGGNRWSTIYAGTGAIATSDEREKQQVEDIEAAALRAWGKVEFKRFKFNDAVEAKGDKARWHFGVIAQRVKEAFESEGLDPFKYGVLCYDEWEGGSRYGIRYEEALVLECAYLRSKLGV